MLRKMRKPLGMQKELYEHLTVHKAPVNEPFKCSKDCEKI